MDASDASPSSMSPGSVLVGKYRIDRVLGRGGMAVVLAATHVQLREPVAIKVLHRQVLAHPGAFERFLREARVAMRLRSEHVARVHDIGTMEDGTPFIVMELLRGADLATTLAEQGPLPLSEAVDYLLQACQALVEAHASGVVHRDLKPANLFLCSSIDGLPSVKVLDFGVSKLLMDDAAAPDPFALTAPPSGSHPAAASDGASALRAARSTPDEGPTPAPGISESAPGGVTLTRAFLGSPQYMAPEQIKSARDVDARADIWALGVILYELVTGARPFRGETLGALCDCILDRHAAPLPATAPRAAELEAVLASCLAKDPAERYQSVRAFAEAVVRFASPAGKGSYERIVRMTEPPSAPRTARSRGLVVEPTLDSGQARPGSIGGGVSAAPAPARRSALRLAGFVAALGAIAGGTVLVRGKMAERTAERAAAARCASNAACTKASGGAPSLCGADGGCVALGSEDCVVIADRVALESPDTVWIGAMLPKDERSPNDCDLNAVKLATEDFAQMMAGFAGTPGQGQDTRVRPLGAVVCDDSKEPMRAARHLVEDVRVPAIVGFAAAKEVVDVGGALMVPNDVVGVGSISTSPLVTRLPTRPGQPRLMWRTTYSFAEVAKAMVKVVSDLFEPELRAAHVVGAPAAPMRVALFRNNKMLAGPTADTILFETLRFNGKSALENGSDYREIVLDVSDPSKLEANVKDVVLKLDHFAPHVILYMGSQAPKIVTALEDAWSHAGFRPRYLVSTAVPRSLFSWMGTSGERRRRFFGLEPASTPVNARFVMHYNENAAVKATTTDDPNTTYDAFYLLAYASYALGDAPVTGPNLSRAIARLVPPGKRIDVGPEGIFDAYATLRRGENIDLNGATGSLDFDLATGEAPFDHAVVCVGVDEAGAATDSVESGLVYRSAANLLEGTLRCP